MPEEPSPRAGAAMTLHAASGKVVLFGGGGRVSLGDTWTWDGERWEEQHPDHQPPPRQHSAMAYDPTRGEILLFGGDSDLGSGRPELLADTWAWNGDDWRHIERRHSPDPGPTPHMAFDLTARRIVLVTQPTAWSPEHAVSATETWTWDGDNWAHHATMPRPILEGFTEVGAPGAIRDRPTHGGTGPNGLTTAMASEPVGGHVVLVQRVQHANTVPGPTATWTWTGDGWHLADVHDAPEPPPTNPLLVADEAGHRVLYIDIAARLWAWDGATWAAIEDGPGALRRGAACMTVDARSRLVLFGGAAAPPGGLYSDTWTWAKEEGWRRRAGSAEPAAIVRPPVVLPPTDISAEQAMRLAATQGLIGRNGVAVRAVAGRARDFHHSGGGSPGGDRYVWAVQFTGTFSVRLGPPGSPRHQAPHTSACLLLDYVTGEFVQSSIPAPPQLTEGRPRLV